MCPYLESEHRCARWQLYLAALEPVLVASLDECQLPKKIILHKDPWEKIEMPFIGREISVP